MTDEPFVNDTIMFESGIPVRFHNGGHGGCPSVNVPLPGDEGDVLTVVAGAPAWAPPSGGGGGGDSTVVGFPSPEWLIKRRPFYLPGEVALPHYQPAVSFAAWPVIDDADSITLGSGTGTSTGSLTLPTTTDGQTLATPKSGFSASYLRPVSNSAITPPSCLHSTNSYTSTIDLPIYWKIKVTLGSSPSYTWQVGTSTDADAYGSGNGSFTGGNSCIYIPSAINTTSTLSGGVRFSAAWTGSRTWSVTIDRVSMV
jgi:hypothetical protein